MITKIKCANYKRYKAVRKPTCGCLCCFLKYYKGKTRRRATVSAAASAKYDPFKCE